MSMKALSHVWESKTGGPAEKLVAAILADHANDDWECFPSVARIAKRADMSERGVRKCLRRLEESGFISTIQNDAQRGCNRYRINASTPEPRSALNHVPPEQSSPHPGTLFPLPPEPRSADPGTTFPRTLIEPPSLTTIEPKEKESTVAERIWKAYRHKTGRPRALKYIARDLKKGDKESDIIAGVERYNRFIEAEHARGFARSYKDGGAFFNDRMWEADWAIPVVGGQSLQPGGMNSERKFDRKAHDALMIHNQLAIGLDPYDES